MAIAGQQKRLTVELTVKLGSRIETLPFTIEIKSVDGKSSLRKAYFMRLSKHQ